MRKIYKIKEAGAEFNRGWRWAHNMAKRGLLDFARVPGCSRNIGITAESVERLKRQAAKTGKVVRHV
jgi:hypothetical protein